MTNLSSKIKLFQDKYDKFLASKEEFKKDNDILLDKFNHFLNLESSDIVNRGYGASTNGVITRDGLYISDVGNTLTDNEFCKLNSMSSTSYSINQYKDFDSNNEVFYAENNVDFTNKPCDTFNELVQVGLDDFKYSNNSNDGTTKMCLFSNDSAFANKFTSEKVGNEKCNNNHIEICQSMAKMKKDGNDINRVYGIGNKNSGTNECYCYISNTEDMGDQMQYEKRLQDIYVFENNDVAMLGLMMDGSLMTFKKNQLKNTHDGQFNTNENDSELLDSFGARNANCNIYSGKGPHSMDITFDPNQKCLTAS